MSKKVYVLIGSYGCGKTELSLNMAVRAARDGKKTALVDLDIVNPFFRSGFHKEMLDQEGVNLIASEYTLEASDVPVVSPEVNAAFDSDYDTVIFDVGGDPVGATALGQYRQRFLNLEPSSLEVLFIVNTRRPLTQNIEDIEEMLEKVGACARLPITGLVNNTNLAAESDIPLLREGQDMLLAVSKDTDIPILYYGIKEELYMASKAELTDILGSPLLINTYTRLNWLDYQPRI